MVKQVRAARTRQALIRAAAEAFAHDGYARASLPAISGRAGVSAGALHFHFPSKDALAREIEGAAAYSVRELAECAGSTETGAAGTLVGAIRRLVVALAADPVVRAGFVLSADPARRDGTAALDTWHDWVRDTARRAHEAGELRDGVSPEGVATVVVAATVGFERLGGPHRDPESEDRMVEFWTCLLPRLTAAPVPGPALMPTGEPVAGRGAESSMAGL
ncbi:ScbR family autoregulator-binding transcription factor [Streptomyces sp. NPDC101169]|uniref:ScbR family autoregulator-binding transcription factor n=1 Tax=Streptomyces sp. NPDC101169 TaxID=3366121 RepID=UPI0038243D54